MNLYGIHNIRIDRNKTKINVFFEEFLGSNILILDVIFIYLEKI